MAKRWEKQVQSEEPNPLPRQSAISPKAWAISIEVPSRIPQGVPEAGGPPGSASYAFKEHLLRPPDLNAFPDPGNPRVDKFPGHHGGISVRQQEQGLFKLGSLAFVDRQGKGGLMLRQPYRGEFSHRTVRGEKVGA